MSANFLYNYVDRLHVKCHRLSLISGRLYIDFPNCLLYIQKVTIDPENSDAKCFQYAITVVLNHEKMVQNPQRISKLILS